MNNDDQKIVWKKSSSKKTTVSEANNSEATTEPLDLLNWKEAKKPSAGESSGHAASNLDNAVSTFNETDAVDMGIRSADMRANNDITQESSNPDVISDVRSDIEKMLSGDTSVEDATASVPVPPVAKEISTEESASSFNIKDEIDKILKKQETESVDIPVKEEPAIESVDVMSDNIDALKASIHEELGQNIITPEAAVVENTTKGIEQTYYGDVSGAMGSNKPATMAELLRKARFEKKERSILSPTSKRNMLFIIGGIVLLGIAIFLLSNVFKTEKQVEYITEKRVDSLVFSNLDTGINLSNVGSEKGKQAIRKVIETEIDEGSVNQIYYIGEDGNKNLRRLNIKQVFDATEHTPPQLLYENLESDFMHGVYKTDENHPFLILKSLTYDKVFEGMQEWEPSMIDDLATYLDLPPEATDRSLIRDGFYDDIINNKNVRVARFIPRESDRSLIERIGDRIIETSAQLFDNAYAQASYIIHGTVTDSVTGLALDNATVFVQDLGVTTTSNATGNYNVEVMPGVHKFQYRHDGYITRTYTIDQGTQFNVALSPLPDNTSDTGLSDSIVDNGSNLVCYQNIKKCYNESGIDVDASEFGKPGIRCYDELKNGVNDKQFDSSYSGKDGYSCFGVAGTTNYLGGDFFVSTLNTDDVCFHAITGDRINTTDQTRDDYVSPTHPSAVCFNSYECHRYACYDRNNNDVGLDNEGQPGVTCGETFQEVPADYAGRKVCREFTDLRLLTNINNSKLCFDENGKFTQSFTGGSFDDDITNDVNCITPTNRNQRLCLDSNNTVVIPAPGTDESDFKICFEPLLGASSAYTGNVSNQGISEQFGSLNQDLRALAASLGRELEIIAMMATVAGMDPDKVKGINDASDFFYNIAYLNVLDSKIIEEALTIVRTLEIILNIVDPTGNLSVPGPDGTLNIFGKLNLAIDVIKKAFGFTHNASWVTIGNKLPKGTEIYAGETVDGVGAIQDTLVILGLMSPVSVTGTLDLVTQEALSDFQDFNDIGVTGIVDLETLELLTGIVEGAGALYGEGTIATIDDYLAFPPLSEGTTLAGEGTIGYGSYSVDVQSLQIILYSQGYDIEAINGVFDPQTCEALMQYQEFNHLVLADPDGGCTISIETIEALNTLIREGNYLGSGFALNPNGFLEGTGNLAGIVGPGVVSFATDVEAASLHEGDIILMYTFLDEQTILITRHESVITEIIKRRALDDIFNK